LACAISPSAPTAQKKRPDPFLEFALAWLSRNAPRNPGREAVIGWDAGQFHQRSGRIVALLDLEFGHIGDPLADLGGRCRISSNSTPPWPIRFPAPTTC
jgi:hypothetical protein